MQFVGNFKEYIDYKALDYMVNNTGIVKPDPVIADFQQTIYKEWTDVNYDVSRLRWEAFRGEHFDWEIKMPFGNGTGWWFSKLMPGDSIPMHVDPLKEVGVGKRYFMCYQDYVPGHIFIHDNVLLSDYKQGDVFEFTHPEMFHCAANLSNVKGPKISLQWHVY